MRSLAIASLLAAAVLSSAASLTATFDELSEGMFGPQMISGGVGLFDVDQDLGGGDNFTIERADDGTLGQWLSPPNDCGFGGYVPGPGMAFGRFKSFSFEIAGGWTSMRSASLDF